MDHITFFDKKKFSCKEIHPFIEEVDTTKSYDEYPASEVSKGQENDVQS